MISEWQKNLIKEVAYQQLIRYLSIGPTDLNIIEGRYDYTSAIGIKYYDTLFVNIPTFQYNILQNNRQIETVENSIKRGCNGGNNLDIRFSVVSLNAHDNPEIKYFQLFISYSTKYKDFVQNLKDALFPYGINCFIAHMDISPGQAWSKILKDKIKNTNAFCAFITHEFISSAWCNQEAGMALAYDKVIFPIMVNMKKKVKRKVKRKQKLPIYGFLEEKEGIFIEDPANVEELTKKIIHGIYDDEGCKNLFLDSYIERVLTVTTTDNARKHIELLANFNHIDDTHIQQLHTRFRSNRMLLECKTDYNRIFEQYDLPKID